MGQSSSRPSRPLRVPHSPPRIPANWYCYGDQAHIPSTIFSPIFVDRPHVQTLSGPAKRANLGTLSVLPPELLTQIIYYLDLRSALELSHTNLRAHEFIASMPAFICFRASALRSLRLVFYNHIADQISIPQFWRLVKAGKKCSGCGKLEELLVAPLSMRRQRCCANIDIVELKPSPLAAETWSLACPKSITWLSFPNIGSESMASGKDSDCNVAMLDKAWLSGLCAMEFQNRMDTVFDYIIMFLLVVGFRIRVDGMGDMVMGERPSGEFPRPHAGLPVVRMRAGNS